MYIDKLGKRFNVYATHEIDGTTYYDGQILKFPDVLERIGVVEINEPLAPDDYSDELYYRTESDDAPYVVYTRKSDEQIKQIKDCRIQNQIDAIESSENLSRQVREKMLEEPGAESTGWYKKVKAVDDKVAALRALLSTSASPSKATRIAELGSKYQRALAGLQDKLLLVLFAGGAEEGAKREALRAEADALRAQYLADLLAIKKG